MCSTAQMRSRTIAGGARERDSLSRQQSGAAVFATPIRPVFAHRNAVRTRQSYPTGTSYMVLRRSSYPPNVITTVPKSKYARRYNVPLEPRTRLDPVVYGLPEASGRQY